jgi:CDP-paratose 2-epimerase
MSVAIVTGSSGLIGSETVRFLHEQGLDVVGVDNNLRRYFFGDDGSVHWNTERLKQDLSRFTHHDDDIRDAERMDALFREHGKDIVLVVHAAAQPSHDWAAIEPATDFSVNATGTLVLLEATRRFAPDTSFIYLSTNKVYGDAPNRLPLVEQASRWELDTAHPFHRHGIDETFSIDQSLHSLFGVSKAAADLMVQEYGRYFGLNTVCFRGGCLTGPAHSGAELHGFLAYLVKCAVTGKPYTIYGYKAKQVRDNIHSSDLVRCFWEFFDAPRQGAVYNIGGGRHSNCSMLEAIELTQKLSGCRLDHQIVDQPRVGDHIWWISDTRAFQRDYPEWGYRYDLETMLREIVEATVERHT